MGGVPTIWAAVSGYLEESGRRLPKVHTVVCGGSAIPRALMERMDQLGLRMLHAWGMTETSPIGSTARPRSACPPEEELDVRLRQGYPTPLVELRIADPETSAPLPWDGIAFGEIQVRGPWIASGYYRGVEPDKLTQAGRFRTGDVAKITPDGGVMIVDRTKDVIKSGGEWISSVALENAIMGHPKVLEAAVIGLPHPRWDERPVAFVVTRPGNTLSADELKAFLEDKFASWWLPDEVRLVEQIPKTSVGKFDKKVLRAGATPIAGTKRER
jgi:fatty-acyl-CoA synthase